MAYCHLDQLWIAIFSMSRAALNKDPFAKMGAHGVYLLADGFSNHPRTAPELGRASGM